MTCEDNNHEEDARAGVSSMSLLRVGTPVWIKRKGHNTFTEEGVVAYLGPVKFAPGDDWVGVQLKGASAYHGKNSGAVNGTFYFETSVPNSGIFVRMDHVSLRTPSGSKPPLAPLVVSALQCPIPRPPGPKRSASTPSQRPVSNTFSARNSRSSKVGLQSKDTSARNVFAKEKRRLEELEKRRQEEKALQKERSRRLSFKSNSLKKPSLPKTLLGLTVSFNINGEEIEDYEHHDHHPPQPDRNYCYADEDEHEIEFDDLTGASTIETIHHLEDDNKHIQNDDVTYEPKLTASLEDDDVALSETLIKTDDSQKLNEKIDGEVRERLKVLHDWRSDRFSELEKVAFELAPCKGTDEAVATPSSSPRRIPAGWRIAVGDRIRSIDGKVEKAPPLSGTPRTAPNSPDSTAENETLRSLHRQESATTPLQNNFAADENVETAAKDDEEILFADNSSSLFRDGSGSEHLHQAEDENDDEGVEVHVRNLEVLRTDLAHAEQVYGQRGDVNDLDIILDPSKNQQEGLKHKKNESNTESNTNTCSAEVTARITNTSCFLNLALMYCVFLMAFIYLSWTRQKKSDKEVHIPLVEEQEERKENNCKENEDEVKSSVQKRKVANLRKNQRVLSKIKGALLSFSHSRSANNRLGRAKAHNYYGKLEERQAHTKLLPHDEECHCSSCTCERLSSSVSGEGSHASKPRHTKIQGPAESL